MYRVENMHIKINKFTLYKYSRSHAITRKHFHMDMNTSVEVLDGIQKVLSA